MQQSQSTSDVQSVRHLHVLTNQFVEETVQASDATEDIYEYFGQLLAALRGRAGVTLLRLAEGIFPPFFQECGVEELSMKTYGNLERDERFPRFEELWPIFLGFVKGCGIALTRIEQRQYVSLAERKLKTSPRKYSAVQPSQWKDLERRIAEYAPQAEGRQHTQPKQDQQVTQAEFVEEDEKAVQFDVTHVVGRDEFVRKQFSYLEKVPRKKIIIVQAMTGIGKTTVLKLLAKRLGEMEGYRRVLLYRLEASQDKTPQDHLDTVLARLLQDLGGPQSEMVTQSLDKRIQRIIKALQAQPHPLVLLLDDFQFALEEDGALSAEWQQWLSAIVEKDHKASLYIATRLWPRWQEREHAFVEETRLEELSPPVGAELFRHLGYEDVSEDLLQAASRKCGGNANFIELRAASLKRQRFDFDWDDDSGFSGQAQPGNEPQNNTERIKNFLQDPRVVDETDLETQQLLRQVIGRHLSQDGLRLLEVLSLAVVPLAFPLLKKVSDNVQYAFAELQKASFVDYQTPKRAQVLPLVREAGMQRLLEQGRVQEIEALLAEMYQQWLAIGTFRSESEREKGDVVAELAVLLLKHQRVLQAAELLIRFGWLAFNQGHALRLARLAEQTIRDKRYQTTPENTCGEILLHYQLSLFLGKKVHSEQRAVDYQRIHDFIFAEKVKLDPQTELHAMHHRMLAAMNKSYFSQAKTLLDAYCTRFETIKHDIDLQETLLEKRAWLFGKWGVYLEEQQRFQEGRELQEQSIAFYKECVELLSRERKLSSLEETSVKKRLGIILNGIAYRLNKLGDYEQALHYVERSIELKERGYVDVGALAASWGEKSQILANLGQFREALIEDEKAFAEVERLANDGHSPSQEEIWIYRVNRGRLFLLLGRVDEAYKLIKDAYDHIHERRRVYKMIAKESLEEINAWRYVNPGPPYQLDWRWTQRYRDLISYDPYWWWAQAGPFNDEEKRLWDQLFTAGSIDKQTRKQLNALIAQSRQREITMAIVEQREPHLWYPVLNVEEVRESIAALYQLDNEILDKEPNPLVRRLYHDAIEEQVQYLQMIEATSERDSTKFWELNRSLYPPSTTEEMQYPLQQVKHTLWQGLQCEETKVVSQQLLGLVEEQFRMTFDFSSVKDIEKLPRLEPNAPEKMVTARTAQRFLEWVLCENGYEGWQVVIDPKANGASVYSAQRRLVLQDTDISLQQIKHYLSHELAGHVARTFAGERSPLGILATGTKNYMLTEEGLALYNEKQTMQLYGGTFDDSGSWLGMLAVGLVTGVVTPPQTFSRLYMFFELFLLIRRLLRKQDADLETAKKQARKKALDRCIRTYRGVPNFEQAGICFSKDVVYRRGLRMIELAVQEDPAILHQLAVGKVARDYVDLLRELELVAPPSGLRELAHGPDLDERILSFERI